MRALGCVASSGAWIHASGFIVDAIVRSHGNKSAQSPAGAGGTARLAWRINQKPRRFSHVGPAQVVK